MIAEGYKHNFETLLRASTNGDLSLLECVNTQTKQTEIVICAVHHQLPDEYVFTPLAKMFNGNPFEEVFPTSPMGDKNVIPEGVVKQSAVKPLQPTSYSAGPTSVRQEEVRAPEARTEGTDEVSDRGEEDPT